jgi:hypothetical protein
MTWLIDSDLGQPEAAIADPRKQRQGCRRSTCHVGAYDCF